MFDRQSKLALIVVSVVFVACGVGFESALDYLDMYLSKESVPMRTPFAQVSTTIGSWRQLGKERYLEEASIETLGTRQYLDRTYQDEAAGSVINVHLAYYTGLIDPVPHVPDRCLMAAGFELKTLPSNIPLSLDRKNWTSQPDRINQATGIPYEVINTRHSFTGERLEVVMPVGEFRLRTTQFEHPEMPGARIFAGYFFVANGRTTPSPDGVRLLAFNLSERRAYYCKVQFTVTGRADFSEEEFVTRIATFLDDFLPELMRCLPDWSEVEALDSAPDGVSVAQPE